MCSCGRRDPHVVLSRETFDGQRVSLYSTGVFSGKIPGLPSRPPRDPADLPLRLRAGRLLLGEVCLLERCEVAAAWKAALKAAQGDGLPGTLRRHLAAHRARQRPRLLLSWQVTATDRDGRPRERQARLPRLRWPGLVVFDYCNGPGSSRGRYEVLRLDDQDREIAYTTGMSFSRLADLQDYLLSLDPPEEEEQEDARAFRRQRWED